jgi:DNA-binding NtrC family response regulator
MVAVLLVDDDQAALQSLARVLKAAGLTAALHAASTAGKALELLREFSPQVLVLDLSLNETEGVESGFSLLRQVREFDVSCRIIVLTGHGGIEFGIRALELGAANFLQKPADIPHLCALIRDGIAQAEIKREQLRLLAEARNAGHSRILGHSAAMTRLRNQIAYAAGTGQSVLILGETGTGKGLCAVEIHRQSARKLEHFICYQPRFGTADLVNSDLFGHVKGAFTGAVENRRGLIAEAHGGTLFLDEVDQLPLETQITLLGVLQNKLVRPLGANKDDKVDFRLLAASNADLQKSIADVHVRSDFYHRIAHYVIQLPPLRAHKEDLELLAQETLTRLREREQLNIISLELSALEKLLAYEWPGNVRELEAVIEGSAYHAQFEGRAHISQADVEFQRSFGGGANEASTFSEKVAAYKLQLIKTALAECGGNQVQAAQKLGLDRTSLRRILAREKP